MGRGRFLGGCVLLAALVLPAAAQELAMGTSPRLTFERTNRRLPRTGDPIWDLKVEIPGQPVRHFAAVSGRAEFQEANRHQMGSQSPLAAWSLCDWRGGAPGQGVPQGAWAGLDWP